LTEGAAAQLCNGYALLHLQKVIKMIFVQLCLMREARN